MTRLLIVTICVFLGSMGCSSKPDRPDPEPVTGSKTDESINVATGPFQVARDWLSSEAAADHSSLLGDSPMIERVWADGDRYRALAAPRAAGNGQGSGMVLTLVFKDGAWSVVESAKVPASVLWPGI